MSDRYNERYNPDNELPWEFSKCPKCSGDCLELIGTTGTLYECRDCHQRMDQRDYITWAIKNFWPYIEKESILSECFEGVNHE